VKRLASFQFRKVIVTLTGIYEALIVHWFSHDAKFRGTEMHLNSDHDKQRYVS
jgi:hypothetical protein